MHLVLGLLSATALSLLISLALMISFMLYTVWELDNPFQGDVRIRPTAFQHALEIIKEAN